MFSLGPLPYQTPEFRARVRGLAERGVWLGTSSWKYPGWCGQLYDEQRYVYRRRFSERRFEEFCLAEYAQVFPTVCVDAGYYQFPSESWLRGLVDQVPPAFRFAFKVTDEITIKRFPNLPRFGSRAGQLNSSFLDAGRFGDAFLGPCVPFRDRIGVLVFEFSRFHPGDFAHGGEFRDALDRFLAALPPGWTCAVEVRNREFLAPDHFAMLARHKVAHVLNSWEAMPALGDQMALPGSFPQPDFCAARFLLRPGRRYEEAVKAFSPYARIQDPYPEGRAAGARLIRRIATDGTPRRGFLYVNNRFEGNALQTLDAMMREAGY